MQNIQNITEIQERVDILRRIIDRGIEYGLSIKDNSVIDLFEHLRIELNYLKSTIGEMKNTKGQKAIAVSTRSCV